MESKGKQDFKGFSLFNDIEDVNLRLRNRAVIMANIMEDNSFKGKISAKGAVLLMGYLDAIPEKERADVLRETELQAKARGFQ